MDIHWWEKEERSRYRSGSDRLAVRECEGSTAAFCFLERLGRKIEVNAQIKWSGEAEFFFLLP